MRTIIHDIDDFNFFVYPDDRIINGKDFKPCIGCFKCWTNKDTCFICDDFYDNGKMMLNCDEFIIISKCVNGCYGSDVKKLLERSISYVEPFFTIRDKEIHHKAKASRNIVFKVYFYGKKITKKEREIATNLVFRNCINLYAKKPVVEFYNDYKEIKL